MRDAYHESLDAVTDELVTMSRLVGSMMQRASVALLEADRERAESVIAADDEVDAAFQELELQTTELIALQQPVATDLRIVLSAMRMSSTLERMGDLAQHVAKSARMRYPDCAVPELLRAAVHRDGRGRGPDGRQDGRRHRLQGPRPGPRDRVGRRPHGRPAPRGAGHPAQPAGLHADRRGRRHHLAQPVLRAVRRPRGQRRPPDHLPGDRRARRRLDLSGRGTTYSSSTP